MRDDLIFAKDKDGHYRYISRKKQRRGFKAVTFLFYLIAFAVLAGIGYYFYTDIYEVYLVKKEIVIDNGEYYQIELLPKNSKYFKYENYIYESSDPNIISVDKYGGIQAISNGTATVSIRYKNGIEKKALKVSVDNVVVKTIAVEDTIDVNKNETKKVEVKVNDNENLSTNVKYKSSDKEIFTVDDAGNVTGVNDGIGLLTVTTPDGLKDTSKVIVNSVDEEIQQISFENVNIELKKGEKKRLTLHTVPVSASTKDIIWKSSDSDVVSVDSNGKITAKTVGSAKITARTSNGLDAICLVDVIEEKELVLSTYNENLTVGEEVKITSNLDSEFISSNNSIASVDENGRVKAHSKGKVAITVRSNNKESSCIVNISEKNIEVESIKMIDTINLYIGESYEIKTTINPSNATNKKITWNSSNPNVASVDSDGNVKALETGQAIIVAKAKNGVNSKTIVYVNEKIIAVESIKLDLSEVNLTEGSIISISPTIKPSNASNKIITWYSENEKIATVDEYGNVKALKNGTTKVVAQTNNGKTASVTIKVKTPTITTKTLNLNKKSDKLLIGNTLKLIATVSPIDSVSRTISWSSSNSSVASVDKNGNVKALKVGSTTISATSSDGLTAKCSITVSTIEVEKVDIKESSLSIKLGSTGQLTGEVSPSNAISKTIYWSSSDSSIVSVDSNGKLTALKAGSVTIYAKSNNGKSDSCLVTVEDIKPTKISIDQSNVKMVVGDSKSLSITYTPSNTTDKTLAWSSNNTSVVSVDSNGKIKALKSGSAKITAYLKSDSSIKSEVSITVTSNTIDVTSISLDKRYVNMEIGNTIILKSIITPSNATNQSVTWSSANTKVVTVNSNGLVTAVGAGETYIVASNNSKTAICRVKVKSPNVLVKGIFISSNTNIIYVGSSIALPVSINPTNATNKAINWTSSDTKIATVDSSGKVTGKSEGSVIITAVSQSNPTAASSIYILVRNKVIDVTSVTLNKTSLSLNKGATSTLTATVSPSNATNQKVTWSSTNTKAATVNSNGLVTAVGAGEAYIVASSSNGKQGKCKVTVKNIVNVEKVTLNTYNFTIYEGKTYQLKTTITPSNATNQTIKYSSTNTAVAKVNQSGKITAVAAGAAQITATASNGKKATVNVIVVRFSIVGSYEGKTLRYYGEKPNNRFFYTRIWVKDAYNQMKVAITPKMTKASSTLSKFNNCFNNANRTYTMYKPSSPYTIITNEIKNKGYTNKALIAVNASAMVSDRFNKECACSWYGTAAHPYVLVNGKVIRNSIGSVNCGHNYEYGLTKDYKLKMYTFARDKSTSTTTFTEAQINRRVAKNKKAVEEIIADGVKYTFGFSGSIVENGQMTNNKDDKNVRQAICQIDKNNYMLITTTTTNRDAGLSMKDLGEIFTYYHCESAYNLDGGGSTSYYYKTNKNDLTSVSTLYDGRDLGDMLYFVEQ